ncbi:hypothetical protein RRG08_004759 [Elysia crispata]|uniref:Uncharacterized protein n=1 Tax=Elysia crispata TaxID=231223 RepID=A0AAE1AIC6_9GAST|nr:hypothetical protein RRG08_004759 [Elysia crispata]
MDAALKLRKEDQVVFMDDNLSGNRRVSLVTISSFLHQHPGWQCGPRLCQQRTTTVKENNKTEAAHKTTWNKRASYFPQVPAGILHRDAGRKHQISSVNSVDRQQQYRLETEMLGLHVFTCSPRQRHSETLREEEYCS